MSAGDVFPEDGSCYGHPEPVLWDLYVEGETVTRRNERHTRAKAICARLPCHPAVHREPRPHPRRRRARRNRVRAQPQQVRRLRRAGRDRAGQVEAQGQLRTVVVSPAQYRVLRALLHDGADNDTLARRLGIGVPTIKDHLRVLFAATGTTTRTELVVAVLRGRVRVTDIDEEAA